MKAAILALVSISLSVAAQFALKHGVSLAKETHGPVTGSLAALSGTLLSPMVIVGLALYGLSAVAWLAVLSHWEVSRAYPLVGLGFVFTAGIGYLLGEHVTPMRVAGVLLICAGVALVGRS